MQLETEEIEESGLRRKGMASAKILKRGEEKEGNAVDKYPWIERA